MIKNKLLLFIILILMFSFSISYASAISTLRYDGEDHDYNAKDVTLVLNNAVFTPAQNQMPPIILNNRTLVPVREVFELLGGKVDWEDSTRKVSVSFGDKNISLWINNNTANVNGKDITLDVPAKIINNKTMVPVRFISEQGGLIVDWDAATYTVSIKYNKANITNISFANINGINCMVVTSDSPITGYKYSSLPKDDKNPFRLILDIVNCNFAFDTTNKRFDSGMLSAVRFGDQGNDVHRVVLDLTSETDYVVALSKDRLKLYYALALEFTPPEDKTNEVKDEEIIEPIDNSGDNIVINQSSQVEEDKSSFKSGDAISGDAISGEKKKEQVDYPIIIQDEEPIKEEEEEIKYDVSISSIKYSTSSKRVKIQFDGTIKYDSSVLENPDRLIVDIKNAKLDTQGPTDISIKNSIITGIRFSQYTKDSVRIVLDVSGKIEHKIYLKSSEIQIEVNESNYKNLKYKKNSSNSQITLLNADIDDLKFKQDSSTFRYYITFNSSDYDFGSGVLNASDSFIKSITTSPGKITILDCGNMTYSAKQFSKNVVITVREEEKVKQKEAYIEEIINSQPSGDPSSDKKIDDRLKKRIFIDVGHGGNDPGACNGEYQEKNINVKIAQYLYDLLSEREDVILDINRTEKNDKTFTVQTRLECALSFNPDLIVSVHINSLENKNYSGTLVLYSNNDTESEYGDITSEECARIITDELANNLGTINRGIAKRDDLHILHDTPCPSVLCEVGFISNDAELERLKTKQFQQAAAQAIYNGIEKILKEM